MCIRDREKVGPSSLFRPLEGSVNLCVVPVISGQGFVLEDEEKPASQGFPAAYVPNEPYIVPVSYTHLDVYKRQAASC